MTSIFEAAHLMNRALEKMQDISSAKHLQKHGENLKKYRSGQGPSPEARNNLVFGPSWSLWNCYSQEGRDE
jgi:hypothetical protein